MDNMTLGIMGPGIGMMIGIIIGSLTKVTDSDKENEDDRETS